MATTMSEDGGGDGAAVCPLCDDYEGPPSSVEAHISRMTDLDHQGEVGRAHRDQLQKEAAETAKSVASEALPSLDSTGDGPEGSVDEGGESSVESTEDSSVESSDVSDVEEGGESSVESTEDSSVDVEVETTDRPVEDTPETAGSVGLGIPVPVSSTTLMVGAAAFLVFALWRATRSSSSSSCASDQDDQEGGGQDSVSNEEVTLFE